ncbi:MAG: aldose 1-epimerase family protein [Pirellula sp.]
MNTQTSWLLRSPKANTESLRSLTSLADQIELPNLIHAGNGAFSIQYRPIDGGRSHGMHCLVVDTGAVVASILPDRGMGIWKCWAGNLECGWQSPVQGPVHPHFVPVNDASGIGWLEGFDELLVRCGLLSNGAPEFANNGSVRYPLHGRIANLPAHYLSVEVDANEGTMDVVGVVSESRFLVYALELQTRYRFRVGSPIIEIVDTVTNRSSQPGSMQMLYHINLGQPILQSGSKIHAAYRSVTPRDARAQSGSDQWPQCQGPTHGYSEQVYYVVPLSNNQHWTEAMLASPDGSRGFSVHFDTRTLPFLNVWKNTVAVEDGYVVGLEPATGYPNPRSVEEQGGRVISLHGGESKSLRLRLQPLASPNEVTQAKSRIDSLQTIRGILADETFRA